MYSVHRLLIEQHALDACCVLLLLLASSIETNTGRKVKGRGMRRRLKFAGSKVGTRFSRRSAFYDRINSIILIFPVYLV